MFIVSISRHMHNNQVAVMGEREAKRVLKRRMTRDSEVGGTEYFSHDLRL